MNICWPCLFKTQVKSYIWLINQGFRRKPGIKWRVFYVLSRGSAKSFSKFKFSYIFFWGKASIFGWWLVKEVYSKCTFCYSVFCDIRWSIRLRSWCCLCLSLRSLNVVSSSSSDDDVSVSGGPW